MLKNTGSQIVGAQMVSASDGSAFTGAVTAYVTGDGGTQSVGSVGSGACTHEGNGFHTYTPSQAETNYNHISFTFIGSGAVPASVQVYTIPEALATASALATVDSNVDAILEDTGTTLPATLATIAGYIDTEIGTIITNLATAQSDLDIITGTNGVLIDDTEAAALLASINAEVDTALADYDAPTKAELDSGLAAIPGAVRTELTTELGRIDVAISTRLAGASYTAPDNASIAAILADTNELQTNQGNWLTATGFSTFDPATDTVAHVTLVDTVTTNTDMRGTDNALLAASYTAPDNASIAAILVDTAEIGAAGAGLTALASASALTTVDAVVDAIKAKTDQLTFTVAGQVDANAESMNGSEILGNGSSGNLWRGA